MRVVLTRQAKENLRDIALFIAHDNPTRARSFVRELQAKAQAIADMPRAFPLLPGHETRGIRRRPHGDGAMDLEALLFPQPDRK